MEFTLADQFKGFLSTSEIFAENAIFDYPLYRTLKAISEENFPEIPAPRARVLGKRMEHFFACYVSHFTSEEILLQNQQVIQEKETLGEIDFLLKDTASEEIFHIELVFKFYIYDPDTGISEKDHLIGPNKRDNLNRKLERLQKRQFPLLFHEAAQNVLQAKGIDVQRVVQKMCFKASVFLPKKMRASALRNINPECVAGFWIKASEFTFEDYGQNTFFSPKKKFWPVLPGQNHSWYSFEEIKVQIAPLLSEKFSPLLWMKTLNGSYQRLFVVWW
ncbi:DUF1853 family protein [Salinimicrobium tongyeongense]|uniref:DUF1853 family protein n=1 Tax=Salinimicrobium tongyeongense TaxID=2809707 RepID=A0ABY6NQP4_9FLAO|nr:DUF1853 family protein [Salinimicrobium tongyeongense]UZH55104.1 DUF1853 family protein [Salinimicrobium tongyeongense]